MPSRCHQGCGAAAAGAMPTPPSASGRAWGAPSWSGHVRSGEGGAVAPLAALPIAGGAVAGVPGLEAAGSRVGPTGDEPGVPVAGPGSAGDLPGVTAAGPVEARGLRGRRPRGGKPGQALGEQHLVAQGRETVAHGIHARHRLGELSLEMSDRVQLLGAHDSSVPEDAPRVPEQAYSSTSDARDAGRTWPGTAAVRTMGGRVVAPAGARTARPVSRGRRRSGR